MEDELARTAFQISYIESELVSANSRQVKTEKIVSELQSRYLHVENDVQKAKQQYEKRSDKLQRMGEFLEKNRQLIKAGNRGLTQVSYRR